MSDERLYGNWLRPQRLTIRGVGWKGALFAVVAYFAGLVVPQAHPRAGLLLLGACLGASGLSALRIGGASAREFLASKARSRYAVSKGTTSFNATGPDKWRLPGPLAGYPDGRRPRRRAHLRRHSRPQRPPNRRHARTRLHRRRSDRRSRGSPTRPQPCDGRCTGRSKGR